MRSLIEQLVGRLPARRPVLMIFEDVHWIDPLPLEMLDLLVERVRMPAVLVVSPTAPSLAPWPATPLTALSLNRLRPASGCGDDRAVAGGKSLPAEILEQIVATTDGVPLFVEELTKTVLESGLLQTRAIGTSFRARCRRSRSPRPCTTR